MPVMTATPAGARAERGLTWVPACAGWTLGTALQLRQPMLSDPVAYAALALLAAVVFALAWRRSGRRAWMRRIATVLVFAALAFAACGLRSLAFQQTALAPALEGRDIVVGGTVVAMPQHSEAGVRLRLAVDSASDATGVVRVPPLIELGWYDGTLMSALPDGTTEAAAQRSSAALTAGDRWRMQVRLKAPHGNRNPFGFDYELSLWERGVQATGYVRAGPRDMAPQRLGEGWSHPIERARQAVRDAIFARVADRALAGVIAALAVGDQNAIERADWDLFRATGVAHLMSISGLHVTMFAWLAGAGIGWGWRRLALGRRSACLMWPAQHAALVGGVTLATAYALFSGWGVPSQRTVLMLAVAGALRLSGRRWPWPAVWSLVCAVVLAVDPWAMLQPGFWLSFVAVGVLFATDPGRAPTAPVVGAGLASRALSAFMSMLREQWIVTLALAPLTLLLFQQVSIIGLVANLLAIPWVTLVVTPLSLLGIAAAPCWDAAGAAVTGLCAVLRVLAQAPAATFSAAAPPLLVGVAAMAGGLLLVQRLPWGVRALSLPLLLPALLWQAPRPPVGHFELLAADIGQGNAVLVRTATHALVYDAGPRYGLDSDAGHRVLVPLLRALGERIDAVVISHRDNDHIGGAEAVLAMQPEARLLSSIEDAHPLQAVRQATRCVAGETWDWDGVRFEVLHPQAADYAGKPKPNAVSCVLRIGNGKTRALLVGDIELAQESRLVAAGQDLRAAVLLVPHHGSKTSSSDAFLDAVQPGLALVQAGYRNRFGHPAAVVAQRYRDRGVKLIETSTCGAVQWSSTVPADARCERDHAMRYWQHRMQTSSSRP